MLDDYIGPESPVIKLLNTYGLGLLGVGLFMVFRALKDRTEAMKDMLTTLKDKYDSTIVTMEKRAQVLDSIFADQKRFQDYYLKMTEDSIKHKDWIKQWKDEEVHAVAERLQKAQTELLEAKKRIEELEVRSDDLQSQLESLRRQVGIRQSVASVR